ncbi:MAG: hypothetical protein M3T96_01985 [Acidobacteriota bacterium]|nr:hypothetical protein [Acidobacteriota bacterium]
MKNGGIHLNNTAQTHGEAQSARSNTHTDVQNAHSSSIAAGSENGAVYTNLDWQTNQGRSRQQATQSAYHGGETSITPNSQGTHSGSSTNNETEVSYDPRYSGYGSDSSHGNAPGGASIYDYNDSSGDHNYSAAQATFNASSNLPLDSNYPSLSVDSGVSAWNDFAALLKNHPDFSDFRNQPPNFWHEVRQLSETRILQDDDGNQLPTASKYENLLSQASPKQLSLDDFAKTLPPPDREVFQARIQIDQTFGANIFENDGVTLNANGQIRLQATFKEGEIDQPPHFRADSLAGKSAPIGNDGAPLTREIAFVDAKKDRSEFGRTPEFKQPAITANNLKNLENSELKSPDKWAQIAANSSSVGNNFLLENGAARTANGGSALSDNSANISAVTRREGGTATVGGALVGNSLTANHSYKNSESGEINKSRSLNNYDANGGKSFAAGATGAMMSAAIGSLISDSKSHIGGAVGFVSGVFVGAEADQGVRWLGADKNISGAAADNSRTLPENSSAPNLNLQTRFA